MLFSDYLQADDADASSSRIPRFYTGMHPIQNAFVLTVIRATSSLFIQYQTLYHI